MAIILCWIASTIGTALVGSVLSIRSNAAAYERGRRDGAADLSQRLRLSQRKQAELPRISDAEIIEYL